jgi:hypothetical protein
MLLVNKANNKVVRKKFIFSENENTRHIVTIVILIITLFSKRFAYKK